MDSEKPKIPQAANDRPDLLSNMPRPVATPGPDYDDVDQHDPDQTDAYARPVSTSAPSARSAPVADDQPRYPFRDNALLADAIEAGRLPFAPALTAPCAVSHFATINDSAPIEADREHLGWLCYSVGAPPPPTDATEHTVEFEGFLVHWENHGPISAYTIIRRQVQGQAFDQLALDGLPEDWLAGLNGVRLFGMHLFYEESTGPERNRAALARLFGRDNYIGTMIAGGKAYLWADSQSGPSWFTEITDSAGAQAQDLIDEWITPVTDSWKEFMDDILMSDLAPVQSMESFQSQYDTLLAAAQTNGADAMDALFDFVRSDYLPFMQSYTAESADYNALWDSLFGASGQLSNFTTQISTGDIENLSSSISNAIQTSLGELVESIQEVNGQLVINLKLDDTTMGTYIADLIRNNSDVNQAIQGVAA